MSRFKCPRCDSRRYALNFNDLVCGCGWRGQLLECVVTADNSNSIEVASVSDNVDTLLRDIGRAAVAVHRLPFEGRDPCEVEEQFYALYAKLTPDQIAACVEWVKKQVKE